MYNPFNPTLPAINNMPVPAPALPPTTEPLEKTIIDSWQGGFPAEPREVRDWLAENMEKAHILTDYELSVELEKHLGKEVWLNTVTCARKDMGITYKYPNNTHGGEPPFSVKKQRIRQWMLENKDKTSTTSVHDLCDELKVILGFSISPGMISSTRRDAGIKANHSVLASLYSSPDTAAVIQWLNNNKEAAANARRADLSEMVFRGTGIRRNSGHLATMRKTLGIESVYKRPYPNTEGDDEKFKTWLAGKPKDQVRDMTTESCIAAFQKATGIKMPRNKASLIKKEMGLSAPRGRIPGKTTAPSRVQNNSHIELLQQVRQMFRIVARSVIDLRVNLGEPVEEDLAALAK